MADNAALRPFLLGMGLPSGRTGYRNNAEIAVTSTNSSQYQGLRNTLRVSWWKSYMLG